MSSKKIQQIIWLSYEDFSKIGEIASKANMAANTAISKILHEALSGDYKPIAEIKKTEIQKQHIYVCGSCLSECPDRASLLAHMKKAHSKGEQ